MQIGFLQLPIKRKHWIAIRQFNNVFYNLDSKLNSPELIGGEADLKAYLQKLLDSGQSELLIIVDKNADKDAVFAQSNAVD